MTGYEGEGKSIVGSQKRRISPLLHQAKWLNTKEVWKGCIGAILHKSSWQCDLFYLKHTVRKFYSNISGGRHLLLEKHVDSPQSSVEGSIENGLLR